jgi:hypothetical protein
MAASMAPDENSPDRVTKGMRQKHKKGREHLGNLVVFFLGRKSIQNSDERLFY